MIGLHVIGTELIDRVSWLPSREDGAAYEDVSAIPELFDRSFLQLER